MEMNQPSPGRVFLGAASTAESETIAALPGFAYSETAPKNAGIEGVRGNLERTPMNQAYFSSANFQIIQNAIRRKVFEDTGKVIDPVGTDDLFMVMRALYLQYGRNKPTQIQEQIADLNDRVVAWCVPKIVAEVSMYATYVKDITTLPTPMPQPMNVGHAGTRSLPFKPYF